MSATPIKRIAAPIIDTGPIEPLTIYRDIKDPDTGRVKRDEMIVKTMEEYISAKARGFTGFSYPRAVYKLDASKIPAWDKFLDEGRPVKTQYEYPVKMRVVQNAEEEKLARENGFIYNPAEKKIRLDGVELEKTWARERQKPLYSRNDQNQNQNQNQGQQQRPNK